MDGQQVASMGALVAGRLLAIDKCPGIRPIGIGETWRRAIAKCILHVVAGKEAKEACGIDQLCAGFESGIEGAIHIHAMLMWETNKAEDVWGFLLIDAKNAFNEQNRTEQPCCGQFGTNGQAEQGSPSTATYKHWATLVIRNNDGAGTFLYSKEGVTQGDPLSMFAYGIGLLPLIRALKDTVSRDGSFLVRGRCWRRRQVRCYQASL
jgi:hypothetical protein